MAKKHASKGKILIISGIVLIALGVLSGVYKQTTTNSAFFGLINTTSTTAPYAEFTISFIVGGGVLILVGYVLKRE